MRSATDLPHVSCRRTVESSYQEFAVSKEDGAGNVLFCRKVRDWRLAGMCAEIFDLRKTIRHCDFFKFTSIRLAQSSPIFVELMMPCPPVPFVLHPISDPRRPLFNAQIPTFDSSALYPTTVNLVPDVAPFTVFKLPGVFAL